MPILLEKALQAGWRVAVRGPDRDGLKPLDDSLWQGAAGSFLPHGIEGGPHDALQPVLLTARSAAAGSLANGPDCLMTVAGAPVTADEVRELARVCVLFDGNDPAAVAVARDQWKALVDAGCAAQYWSEDSGRWEKKAERPARAG